MGFEFDFKFPTLNFRRTKKDIFSLSSVLDIRIESNIFRDKGMDPALHPMTIPVKGFSDMEMEFLLT